MTTLRVIDFMGQRKLAAVISILLVLGSLVSLSVKGISAWSRFYRWHPD